MKKEGKYRFSLQFPDGTEENRRAGDFLEQLGNRKSAVVVAALNEYQDKHPADGEQQGKGRSRLPAVSADIKKELEILVERAVEERMGQQAMQEGNAGGVEKNKKRDPESFQQDGSTDEAPEDIEGDISQMLDNLKLFEEF